MGRFLLKIRLQKRLGKANLRGKLLDWLSWILARLRCELSGDPALLLVTGQVGLKGEPPQA